MSLLYVFFGWKTCIHNYFTFELCICNMREPNWQPPPPPFLLFFAFHRSLSFFRFQGLVATTQRCVDLKPEVSGALTGTSFRVDLFESQAVAKLQKAAEAKVEEASFRSGIHPKKSKKQTSIHENGGVYDVFPQISTHAMNEWMRVFLENCLGNAFQIADQLHGWTWESFLDSDFVTLDYNIPLSPRELSLASFDSPTSGKSENQCGHHEGWLLKILLLMSALHHKFTHNYLQAPPKVRWGGPRSQGPSDCRSCLGLSFFSSKGRTHCWYLGMFMSVKVRRYGSLECVRWWSFRIIRDGSCSMIEWWNDSRWFLVFNLMIIC